jgi:predicted DNA binding CopG/RHH family protein
MTKKSDDRVPKPSSASLKPKERLRQALGDLTSAAFAKDTKDQRLTIRLSGKDRESMEQIAESMGMTVADYLVQLHQVAAERLGNASSD